MSLEDAIGRAFGLASGLLRFAVVKASRAAAAKIGKVQFSGLSGDDETEHWHPYGFQARPLPGAHALQAAVGANSETTITILVGDRRYTLGLEAGEVAVADDLGQKVHLTRTGIVVEAPSIKLGAGAALGAARATDPTAMDADFVPWVTGVDAIVRPLFAAAFAPIVLPPMPVGTGTITIGSSKVTAE